jgi:hypothetical protein
LRRVNFPTIFKRTGSIDLPGFGNVPTSESTGKVDKTKFEISTTGGSFQIEATRIAIHKKLRRLRDQEASQLDSIDRQIEALRLWRAQVLDDAWKKGNIVTVKELIDQIENNDQERDSQNGNQ